MARIAYPYPSLTQWDYQGFDSSSPYFTDAQMAQMAADGVRVFGRYLYDGDKGCTRAEALRWLNHGIALYFYYEVNTTDAVQGYAHGYELGRACQAQIQAVGVPDNTMIFCCCDRDVTDTTARGAVVEFYRGFKAAIPYHSVGIYGGLNVMEAVKAADSGAWLCQAGAWGFEEFDRIDCRQWLISRNSQAYTPNNLNYLRIQGVTVGAGQTPDLMWAYWRGNSVDLVSVPSLEYCWRNASQPRPTPYTPPPAPPSQASPSDGISGSGVKRYHNIDSCPEWSKAVLKSLLDSGKLKGRPNGDLDLSEDMVRILTIIFREEENS